MDEFSEMNKKKCVHDSSGVSKGWKYSFGGVDTGGGFIIDSFIEMSRKKI